MKYLFVLGRNIELSRREILSYFEKEEISVLGESLRGNGLLLDFEENIDSSIISFLGGVLSIGKVLVSSEFEDLKFNLEKAMIYAGEKNKLNYVLWDFSENYDFVLDYLQKRFKEEKLKATLKHLRDKMEMQEGEPVLIPSSKLLDEEYFIFTSEGEEHFGQIVSHCDYESIEKRDMEKPVRRESLAISPRLAKIMINLAGLKKGEMLLDPFCGVGTFLQEALLQGIKVFGVDKDSEAIEGAKKNLQWFGFDKENYSVVNFDSAKVEIPEVGGIATEPDLGQILKKIPTKEKAESTLREFDNLMIQVINNVKKNVSGKIVFTSPYIRIGKKRLNCGIENICESTGYSIVGEGIPEFRGNQIVGRMIWVLRK
jgi:tRNA G10  N-methylase Trm11